MRVTGLGVRALESYAGVAPDDQLSEVRTLSETLRGVSIVHVNSTAFGGGVAEILYNLVPLMNGVGLKAGWEVIEAPNEFFEVTKRIHNGVQGMKVELTGDMKDLYLRVNRANAERLALDGDVVVVHDPQPLAIRAFRDGGMSWVWRCHIDVSSPDPGVWGFLERYVRMYDAYVFHMVDYVQPGLDKSRVFVMPPSIDPLSEKNREMRYEEVLGVLEKYDVDPERPILIQVARFDPWKDPLGVIDVYRLVKERVPDAQLLMVASMAHDDPEGWVYYERTVRKAGEDYDIHFLTNLVGVGAREVNAFQRAATVVLQMSTREGFGLSVTEALWKAKPVVARGSGGIRLQVIHGETGFLVRDVREAADYSVRLIRDPELRRRLGERAREHVRANFLITRHLRDYLRLISKLVKSRKGS